MKIEDTINQYSFNERKRNRWSLKFKYIAGAIITCLILAATSFQGLAQQGSLSLDGDGDYATAGDSPSLDIAGTSITLETWVKHDGNSNTDAFLINKALSGDGYRLQLYGEGDETYVRFVIGDVTNNGPAVFSETGVPANRWTHIAATYDGQFLKIYINGELDATAQENRTIDANDASLTLGANASLTGNFLSGEMDGVRIWSAVRSAAEIGDTYLEELAGGETGLAALYQFSSVSGSTVNDLAGSNTLTLTGDNAGIGSPGAVPIAPDLYTHNGNEKVEVSWDERLGPNDENDAASFEIYRSTQPDGSDRQSIATASSTVTSFTDNSTLTNGQTYYYEITTVDGSGNESDYSHMVSATPYEMMGGGSLHLTKNAYGLVTDRPSLDITETDITVHAWVKHDGQSDENAVIAVKGSTSDGYVLRFDGEGQAPNLAFAIGDITNGGPTIVSNASIPANQWTHVAGTYDGNDLKVYINGELDNTETETRTIDGNDFDLFIGADAAASDQFFSGHIDELGIWSIALARQDIEDNFNKEFTGNEDGLELYYRFDDNGNSIVRSMDTYHTDMEKVPVSGTVTVSAPGVFPVTPYAYTRGRETDAFIEFRNRIEPEPDVNHIYRSSVQDLSDRAKIYTHTPSAGSETYADVFANPENTYYYQVTAENADGQESDLSYPKPARLSSYEAGNALKLDGDLDYVRLDDRNSLDGYEQLYVNFDETMTVEAWVNHDGNSDENAVIVQKGATSDGYRLRLEGTGSSVAASFTIGDITNGGPRVTTNSSIPANQWTHIAATYDGTDLKIYVNGSLDATDSESRSIDPNPQPLLIGGPNALNGNFFSGELDEIRIWNVARTESEIADNFYKQLMGHQEDLISYFRFDESAGSSLTYSSATEAMSGSLNGDATFVNSNALSSQPVVSSPIPEITLDEDFGSYVAADLDTVFQDDDTQNLTYSIVVPCHIVEAEVQNDTSLVFTSLENIFGTDTLTVEATDGATTARQSFIVNVESVNDVPELAGFENDLQVPIDGEFTADMFARTADVESADTALTFTFAVDTSGINVDFDGQVLTLSPNGNFDGSGTLDIEVTDEDGGVKTASVGIQMVTDTDITDETGVPGEFDLANNYPNPFNPTTTIKYALPEAADVRLTVFNSIGQKVADLVNTRQTAGTHQVDFDASQLPSGMYIYRLKAGEFEQIRKMTLVK
ncbi:LamG-like jellyroll fold domain-containing protein [Gracilimonas sp.]|uniref:LamG-like jellyroll fold domain-containing protein n=1 Tax=Gracilimonas sp. TaxID=1974203 RepID=UPI0032ED6B29